MTRIVFSSLVLVVLVARSAHAVVTGTIVGPGSESFPIAVVPPKNLGGDPGGALGARFAKALTRDLDFSGYFKLLDPKTFVENPETSGITAGEIDFVGWAAIGAQALVKGGISASGSGIALEVRLFDVPGRRDVPQASKRFSGGRDDVPRMAHRMADAILEFLTSERGPFDSKMAMVSTRSGRLKDVYIWTFDQDDPVRVTDERSLVIAPRWRPDARALVFASYREHFPRLFQVDVGSRQTARLVPGPGVVLDGAWSPDGTRLLVTREEGGNSDIYLLDRSGQVVQRLTDHWAIDVSPAWAPDGRRFAFCPARTGSPHIYVMHVDGSEVVRVSHTGSYNTSPASAPLSEHTTYTTRGAGGVLVVATTPDGGNP